MTSIFVHTIKCLSIPNDSDIIESFSSNVLLGVPDLFPVSLEKNTHIFCETGYKSARQERMPRCHGGIRTSFQAPAVKLLQLFLQPAYMLKCLGFVSYNNFLNLFSQNDLHDSVS